MNQLKKQKPIKRRIKEAVKNALSGVLIGDNTVEIAKTIPSQVEHLPKILIYSVNETVNRFDEAPKTYERTLNIKIECVVASHAEDDMDSRLEQIAEAVEARIESDETFSGLVHRAELTNVEYESTTEAQSIVGMVALTYELYYKTQPMPGQILREFSGVDTDWKIGHHNESTSEDNVVDAIDIEAIEQNQRS